MENSLLSVKNIALSFTMYDKGLHQRDIIVLKDLSVEVDKGEIVAVVGASGSGKSLLAHAILGILPNNAHLSGNISYKNKELTPKMKNKLRGSEISLVPQSVTYFDPIKKIGKQIRNKYVTALSQRAAFKRYGLSSEVEEMYPFQLSGGMARRALISTAVASGAELLIADEPTPGLTEEQSYEVMKNFRELADEGCGILLITHDIAPALTVADKLCVFFDGATVDFISVEDFKKGGTSITNAFTKALRNALPEFGFNKPEVDIETLVKRGDTNA